MITDLHNDAILELGEKDFYKYIRNIENEVNIIFASVWCTRCKNPIAKIKQCRELINNIKTNIDIKLHIEDAHFLNEDNFYQLMELSPYSVGLTWNYDNNIAGGALSDCGISKAGANIVRMLEYENIFIDSAHLNRKSFWQLVDIADKPLLCTHTCFDEICPHKRNLTRGQIKLIESTSGLIGLTFVPSFLTTMPEATIDDVVKHILYFLDNYDEKILAIGTDYFGTEKLPVGLETYGGFELLKNNLVKYGVGAKTLDNIFYKNAWQFIDRRNL